MALQKYKSVHGHFPARIVLHKTSDFSQIELSAMNGVATQYGIDHVEAISLSDGLSVRVFRNGAYPPLRGTVLHLDQRTHLLYLRGSVDFYQTYPGPYIPRPYAFRCDQAEDTPRVLAQ